MKRLAGFCLAALLAFAPITHADLRASSGAFGPITATSGTAQLDNGLVGSPSYSFTSAPTTGLFLASAGAIGIAGSGVAGVQLGNSFVGLASGGLVAWTAGSSAIAAADTTLSRPGPAVVQVNGASNAAAEYRVSAGNGGFISNVKSVSESLTIAAAATTVGVTSIPAGAILIGVAVRVTTVIPTAATFTITTTVGGTTLNTAAVSTAANSTDPGTAAGASFRSAATTVTITPNLQPAAATGVVRLQYYYIQITPPTS